MKVLVTGAAGFIGMHVSLRLAERGDEVTGVDDLNEYYDVSLKLARLNQLRHYPRFKFVQLDIADRAAMERLFKEGFQRVVTLAAQAGVRYSLKNPHAYLHSNVDGFLNVLEGCRHSRIEHLVFASSSSVYGANLRMPFSVQHNVDHPVSLYAATKKSNELMAHAYSHLYGIPATGLRFFTVYGPWGRPDMAAMIFARAILAGEPIDIYNEGRMKRDFTYIDDIVEGVVRVLDRAPASEPGLDMSTPDPSRSTAPYRLYNIGNHQPVDLMKFIEMIERALGKTALKRMLPIQPGDVPETYADVSDLQRDFGFVPRTPLATGIARFVEWYLAYREHGAGMAKAQSPRQR
jgi:UDP-glucuronate 4-epimerase